MIPQVCKDIFQNEMFHRNREKGMDTVFATIRAADKALFDEDEFLRYLDDILGDHIRNVKVVDADANDTKRMNRLNVVWRYAFYIPMRDLDNILRRTYGNRNWETLYALPFERVDNEIHREATAAVLGYLLTQFRTPLNIVNTENVDDLTLFDIRRAIPGHLFAGINHATSVEIADNPPFDDLEWMAVAQAPFSSIQTAARFSMMRVLTHILESPSRALYEAREAYDANPCTELASVLTDRAYRFALANCEFIHYTNSEIEEATEAYLVSHYHWLINDYKPKAPEMEPVVEAEEGSDDS